MFCPHCGTEAKDEARFCHHCGTPLKSTTLLVPVSPPAAAPLSPAAFKQRQPTVAEVAKPSRPAPRPSLPTGASSVRKGLTQAKFNDENSGIMMAEMTLIAIAAGLVTSSWWWFGGVFLGFIVAVNIRPLANVLAFVLSLGWGILGYGIGMFFDSQAASVVLGVLGFLCGLGLHLSALQWFRDV
jgi:hypothetical protein